MKANNAKMSPDTQKQMQPVIQQAEASVLNTSKDPQMVAMMKQSYVQDEFIAAELSAQSGKMRR
jgi:hypothetical protein